MTKGHLGIVMPGIANGVEKNCIHIILKDIGIVTIQVYLSQGGKNFLIGIVTDDTQGVCNGSDVRESVIIIASDDTSEEWFYSPLIDWVENGQRDFSDFGLF